MSKATVIFDEKGVPRPAKEPLWVQRKSDNLLMFLLKSKRPDKYRDNFRVEHGGDFDQVVARLAAARQRMRETVK
jgi:hypothetical protein